MFAELLNGMICLHNTRMGVDLDDERQRIHQPELRLGVIPAGTYLHLHLRLYTYSTPIFYHIFMYELFFSRFSCFPNFISPDECTCIYQLHAHN